MKVAVTSQNFRTVTGHAGKARRFLVFEAEGGDVREVERLDLPKETSFHELPGDAPHPIDGVDALVTGGCGQGFVARLARRGIRVVASPDEMPASFESARNEAFRAFGDATVFVEKLLVGVRHVEVQVFGDSWGTTWAVGVRDCTVQRRHQKVLEESPAPTLSDETVDTVGGLVVHAFGRLPKRGETVTIGDWRFRIVRADSRRIHTLQVEKVAAAPDAKPEK